MEQGPAFVNLALGAGRRGGRENGAGKKGSKVRDGEEECEKVLITIMKANVYTWLY